MGTILVVVAIILAIIVGFGGRLFDLGAIELLAASVILGFVGVLVGLAFPSWPWSRKQG
jgi:hypothetical protein